MRSKLLLLLVIFTTLSVNSVVWACLSHFQYSNCTSQFCECTGLTKDRCSGPHWIVYGSNSGKTHCYSSGLPVSQGESGFSKTVDDENGCGAKLWTQTTCMWLLDELGGVCHCSTVGTTNQVGMMDESHCDNCTGTVRGPSPIDLISPMYATIEGLPGRIVR